MGQDLSGCGRDAGFLLKISLEVGLKGFALKLTPMAVGRPR